jgi:hypothetical protein
MADLHLFLQAEDGFAEADGEIQAQILTLAWPAAARACRGGATEAAEKRLEQIGQTAHIAHVGHARATPKAGFTKLVVAGAALGIAEHFIGAADLFKAIFSARIFVDVRVILAG